jgi:hypothetical protein
MFVVVQAAGMNNPNIALAMRYNPDCLLLTASQLNAAFIQYLNSWPEPVAAL